ncbi:hypothetical protein [Flavobacterium sp. MMS24-S5]|uniref:hypothetical protein n=1 Tax=Flavobacterium sp. MMS24-S5 TaxID=3416605 RepID=UPI003D091359
MKTLSNILIAILFMNAAFTQAQTSKQKTIEVNSSLGTLKQINAGLLNVGYTEAVSVKRNSSNTTSRLAL